MKFLKKAKKEKVPLKLKGDKEIDKENVKLRKTEINYEKYW